MNNFLRIRTWNMQGGGASKIAYIQPRLDRKVILLCQESGVPNTTGFQRGERYGEYLCLASSVDAAAYNQRCTTSVFVTCDACSAHNTIYCGRCDIFRHMPITTYEATNRMNIITRPYLKVTYNREVCIDIYTYHATANRNSSVVEVIEIIKSIMDYGGNKNWILLGDFNAEPWDFESYTPFDLHAGQFNCMIFRTETRTRVISEHICYMLYPHGHTQGANGYRTSTLDYAFFSDTICNSGIIADITNYYITNEYRVPLSDHNSVSLLLNLNHI